MKLTRRDPTVELMGPKKGNMIAKNHIGITTGSLVKALFNKLLVSCTPRNFSHTKYKGVQANPNVMNCKKHQQASNFRYGVNYNLPKFLHDKIIYAQLEDLIIDNLPGE